MSLPAAFLSDVAQLIPKDRRFDDPLSTLAFGTDASFYRLIPQLVIRVESEDEVVALLQWAQRDHVAVTFRAAGTSLSGQAISDSVLIVLGDNWNGREIRGQGTQIRLQPGVIGAQANAWLAPFGRKIGPDPASINACKIGGIVANNASGMCCGTAQNTYHTLAGIRLVLADGSRLDTEDAASVMAFREQHGALLERLATLGRETRANAELAAKIRQHARNRHRQQGFYRLLNRMLFRAAVPGRRHLVLQRFYKLPKGLIERFYAGRTHAGDIVRILVGKPPVPVHRALACLREAPLLKAKKL